MTAIPVAIGLGSNLGDRAANLDVACDLLRASIPDLVCSSYHRTTAWDCAPGAPDFLNAAAVGRTELEPLALLAACRELEQALGRPAVREYHADRTVDIDLLLYGERVVSLPGLRIPHPGLVERDFVLKPLAEIAADWPIPGTGCTVRQILEQRRETA